MKCAVQQGGWLYIGVRDVTSNVPRTPCQQVAAGIGGDYAIYTPCAKGDIITVAYAGITVQYFRFIYDSGLQTVIKY